MNKHYEGFAPEARTDPAQVRDELFQEARNHPFDPMRGKPIPLRHWRWLKYKNHDIQICLTGSPLSDNRVAYILSMRTLEDGPTPKCIADEIAAIICKEGYTYMTGMGLGKSQQYFMVK